MSTPQETYRFSKSPDERRITIRSEPPIGLRQVILRLEQDGAAGSRSEALTSALEDLRLQEADPALRRTDISGRDARLDRFVLSEDELSQMGRMDPQRWPRFVEYRYKFKIYPRRRILNPFPIVLCVEPTSICNLRCQMCFQSDATFSQEKEFLGRMDPALFKRVVDEMAENRCDSLVIASRGEPTLHPQFAELLAYAAPRILDVKVNTNATRLDEKLCHRILEAEPGILVFSIDSADAAQYEEIRKGARFESVLENIRRFRDIRSAHYPHSRTLTRVSGTIFRADQDSERIRSFWSEYADQVALHGAWPFWDSYSAPLSEVTAPCAVLWERMYLWWDGVCNPCDVDYKSHLALGKAGKTCTIKEIWLGQEARRQRQIHEAMKKNTLTPCNRCSGIA